MLNDVLRRLILLHFREWRLLFERLNLELKARWEVIREIETHV